MKNKVRHRRLHAFYHSKVLNTLMLIIIISLLQIYPTQMVVPIICASTALLFFIGYTLWIWIKKPTTIIINNWLSEMSGLYTLYFLIVTAMKSDNHWWKTLPMLAAIPILFILLTTNHDQSFTIRE